MRAPSASWWLVMAFFSASLAWGEEAVRREEADAGVHVPVMTRAPELTRFVEALYPPDAAAVGKTASVTLLITLDAEGLVSDAQVTESGGAGFDEAALTAVRQFHFQPAEVDGVPAPVQLQYVYHFTLAPPKLEPPPATAAPKPKATLKGQLLARGSRSRVPNATLRCGDSADAPETVSDAQGQFQLEVPAGTCDVRVVAGDFRLFETQEELAPQETAEVNYYLIPRAPGFETVVRGARSKKEVVRRTLERQELQKIPGTFGDPIRVLQNLPGVARAPFVSGALIVRGAAPDQTLTFLDGVQIPLLFHLGGGPSVVNAEFLDRLDFYPGGFGARYGRAIGGVVDVATRKGAKDTVHGSAKVDLLDTGFFVEAPLSDEVSAAAAARRSYVDLLLPVVLPEDPDGGTLLVLPRYWDYQVRMDYSSRKPVVPGQGVSSYYVMAFGSDDTLKVVASGGGRSRDVSLDVHTLFHRLKGDWTYRKGRITSVFTPYGGYDLAKFNFGQARLQGDLYALGAREDLTLELSPWLTARTGFDLRFEHLQGRAQIPAVGGIHYVPFPGAAPKAEIESLARVANAFDGALYGEVDFKLRSLTLTPGLRATAGRIYGQKRQVLDPRLWARFQFNERTAVKGSAGLYSQPPPTLNLDAAPYGNPLLQYERAFQTSLGVERQLTDVLSLDLTGYFNRRYDLVVSPGQAVVAEDGAVTQPLYANGGLGKAYGLEVMLRHAVTRSFFGWIAYTLNRSEFRRAGEEDYGLASFDQTHIFTAVASQRLPWGLELGGRFRYVTGRPESPLRHERDLYDVDTNGFSATYGPYGTARLKSFQQLDLRLDKSWLFNRWTLTAYLDIQNVYNARNVEAVFYDYRYREPATVPGIPFLPVVGVKGSF